MAEEQSNIKQENNSAIAGLNLDNTVNQVAKGKLTYGLNAVVENFDSNSVNYQNEPGNENCINFPEGYKLIGKHFIPEINKQIYFLVNPEEGFSEIGYMDNNDCIYHTYINANCLNFNVNKPIHKVVHKITNCTTEIYWTDGVNPRRFLDLNKIPYTTEVIEGMCDPRILSTIDCNKLNVQPNFDIPTIEVEDVVSGGDNTAGTIQFAIQYSNATGDGYTSYYSVTNPLPLADENFVGLNFNYPVGKSTVLNIRNIDVTGYFQYFNLAVIKTINNIPSVDLVGTYTIENQEKQVIYSGQNQTEIKLTINDIFEKFPYYEIAQDLTTVQDVLVWDQLTSIDRINYQQVANKLKLQWESYRIPNTEDYKNELNATNLRGYLRDEIYPFEIVFLLKNGKQTDGFHIPGRALAPIDNGSGEIPSTNPDFIVEGTSAPYWKIYNTASVTSTNSEYTPYSTYKGSYQIGDFAYWESEDTYPCNTELWGELAGQPIRHHKFPDVLVSPIFENPIIELDGSGNYENLTIQKNAIFPIGVRINVEQVQSAIIQSNLTQDQKDNIAGFKVVRGNRDVNKSIIGKGILRNVGKYEREGTEYYFPNYPYNDLREDPFLLAQSNAYVQECGIWQLVVTGDGEYQFTNCLTNEIDSASMLNGETLTICSITTPVVNTGTATITRIDFDSYTVQLITGSLRIQYDSFPSGATIIKDVSAFSTIKIKVMTGTPVLVLVGSGNYSITQTSTFEGDEECYPDRLSAFTTDASKYRQVFNSPETSFGQPFLGDVLKVENVIFGTGKAHFVEVKKNALYKLITKEAQADALLSSSLIADITGTFSPTAMFTAYQAYLQIYINGITRRNYGWSYNSILGYDYYSDVNNDLGIKQRKLESSQYLFPGVQSVGEDISLNNYQRESSVYLKTTEDYTFLPFPSQTNSLLNGFGNSVIEDKSRYISSQINCSQPEEQFDITSVVYYASLKNSILNQWGQIYTYETIDTGFQVIFDELDFISGDSPYMTVFGGDTFISKFAFKTKLPFFIDNRVNAPDDSDIYYDEIGNVAYPEYWHSARSILYDYDDSNTSLLSNIISIKAHYLDCPNNQLPKPDKNSNPPIVNPNRTFYGGKMYMFAYGIPYFYCESSINTDLRQAFNDREGDFYPHVSSGIPDEWLQESKVTINQDNTYYYNVTYSKQNKENFFSHLPPNWEEQLCFTHFPFREIHSDAQQSFADNRINSWLIYRPVSFFDFPQNYGNLISLDGIENKQVLARFENKSLLYNALYTNQINTGGQVYLGQNLFSKNTPPLDFAETDLGYVGSQNKMLLKIPQGQITVDAKRGQIFLISNSSATDISGFGSGLNRFLKDHLPFEILRHFPTVNTDNNFTGVGLHGVYDSKYNRIIISKLDYIPLSDDIKYDEITQEFYIEKTIPSTTTTSTTQDVTTTTTSSTTTLAPIIIREVVYLTDITYFCNKSWTLSFNFNTMSWISFHSYIPNWYIAENNFFYSGLNEGCDLEAIAAEIVPSTTTTTTTIPGGECELEGTFEIVDCDLEGNAIIIEPTTTTTTTLPPDCNLDGEAVIPNYLINVYTCGTCEFLYTGVLDDAIVLTVGLFYSLNGDVVGEVIGYTSLEPTETLISPTSYATCEEIICI